MEIKKFGKNILDSNSYKVIIKPALNISTGGFYDFVDQFANAIFLDRKNEFISFLNYNYELLQEDEILKNEHFVSGLGILYQEVIKQRFEWKRQRMYGIFLGFINESDKEFFELERMFYTLNLMDQESYEACLIISKADDLQKIGTGNLLELKEKIYSYNEYTTRVPNANNLYLTTLVDFEWAFKFENIIELVWKLENLGILVNDNALRNEFKSSEDIFGKNIGKWENVERENFKLSTFGIKLIQNLSE
jgi:hypothetical protein